MRAWPVSCKPRNAEKRKTDPFLRYEIFEVACATCDLQSLATSPFQLQMLRYLFPAALIQQAT